MLLRRVRTRERVRAEYDAGHWRRVLEQQTWAETPDLRTFLIGNDATPIIAKVDGRVVRIAARDYYRLRLSALVEAVGEHVPDTHQLVELGCGYGYNLFTLALAARWDQLLGLDISDNGLQAGRAIAAQFGLADRVRFDTLDLTAAEHRNFGRIAGQTVFTFCCIEQVPDTVEHVIDNIRRHHPRRVIHIEPTTELLRLSRPLDLLNYAYVKSVDYQTRLFSTLAALAERGEIRLLATRRLPWAPTVHNDTFVAVWEPVDGARA
jgi:SAM-dependent methyltransferase